MSFHKDNTSNRNLRNVHLLRFCGGKLVYNVSRDNEIFDDVYMTDHHNSTGMVSMDQCGNGDRLNDTVSVPRDQHCRMILIFFSSLFAHH